MDSISWELAVKLGTIHNYSNMTYNYTWRAYPESWHLCREHITSHTWRASPESWHLCREHITSHTWRASPESWHLCREHITSHTWRASPEMSGKQKQTPRLSNEESGEPAAKGNPWTPPQATRHSTASTGPLRPNQMAGCQHPLTGTTARSETGPPPTRSQEAIPGTTGTHPELGSPLLVEQEKPPPEEPSPPPTAPEPVHGVLNRSHDCPHLRVNNGSHHRR